MTIDVIHDIDEWCVFMGKLLEESYIQDGYRITLYKLQR